MKTKIGGFGVEFARSGYDPAVLAIAKGRIVMFGCVDPSDAPVPSVANVVERVRQALKYIEPEKSVARSRLRLDDDHPRVWRMPKPNCSWTSRRKSGARSSTEQPTAGFANYLPLCTGG